MQNRTHHHASLPCLDERKQTQKRYIVSRSFCPKSYIKVEFCISQVIIKDDDCYKETEAGGKILEAIERASAKTETVSKVSGKALEAAEWASEVPEKALQADRASEVDKTVRQ